MGMFDNTPGLDGYQKQVALNQAQTEGNVTNFGNAAKMMEYTRGLAQQEQQRKNAIELLPQMSPRAQMVYKMTGDPVKAMEADQQEKFSNKLSALLGGGDSSGQAQPGMSASSAALGGFPASAVTPDSGTQGKTPNGLQIALLGAQGGLTGIKGADELVKLGGMYQDQLKPASSVANSLALKRGEQDITAPYGAPITLKTSNGQEIQLSQPEWASYQQNGQLPARLGGTPPAAPATIFKGPGTKTPAPADFPRVTPQQQQGRDAERQAIIASEVATNTAVINNPQASAQDKATAQQNLASLQREAGASKSIFGTIGASQTQPDQIEQEAASEAAKKRGAFFGGNYADLQKGGMDANAKIAKLDRMASLLEGVNTGKLTPAGTELAAYAQSMGFNVDPALGNKQAAMALSRELALQLRNPSGGAGMPGSLSDADRDFLMSMVPSLANTPQGNSILIESMTKLAKRDQEIASLARDYKDGNLDNGFYKVVQDYADKHPLFSARAKNTATISADGRTATGSIAAPSAPTSVFKGSSPVDALLEKYK